MVSRIDVLTVGMSTFPIGQRLMIPNADQDLNHKTSFIF